MGSDRLASLTLGKGTGFTPGSSFAFNERTWVRGYQIPNYLRGAACDDFAILEQDPLEKTGHGQLARPNHPPHGACDGMKAHEVLQIFQLTPARAHYCWIVDGVPEEG